MYISQFHKHLELSFGLVRLLCDGFVGIGFVFNRFALCAAEISNFFPITNEEFIQIDRLNWLKSVCFFVGFTSSFWKCVRDSEHGTQDMQNIVRQLNVSLLYIMVENDTMLKSNEMVLHLPDYTMAPFFSWANAIACSAFAYTLTFWTLIRSMRQIIWILITRFSVLISNARMWDSGRDFKFCTT